MNKTIAAIFAATALILSGCSATGDASSNGALPQAETSSGSSTKAAAKKPAPAKPAKPKASTCDIAREAILTGTPAEIKAALKKLQADKTADATAREYARYYLGRDAKDAQMREMDISLIQTSCSI